MGVTGPPIYFPPDVGTDPNPSSGEPTGDPWTFGCKSNGMPCGMPFPVGDGGLSGCTYGSGNCGGIIFGATDDENGQAGASSPWYYNIPLFVVGLAKSIYRGTPPRGAPTVNENPPVTTRPWPQPTPTQPPDVGVPGVEDIPPAEVMGKLPWPKWVLYGIMRIVGGGQQIFVPIIVAPNGGCYPWLPCGTGTGPT